MSTWADELIERLQQANRDFSQRLEVAERTKALTASAKNAQYGIEISVGDDCRIERLTLSPEALKLSSRELSAEILRLARSARAKYARELERLNLEVLGDNELSRRILEEIREKYPEDDAEEAEGQSQGAAHSERQLAAWERSPARQLPDDEDEEEGWSWRR